MAGRGTWPGLAAAAVAALLVTAPAGADPGEVPPPGGEAWETDLDAALAASARDRRPILAYFTYDT